MDSSYSSFSPINARYNPFNTNNSSSTGSLFGSNNGGFLTNLFQPSSNQNLLAVGYQLIALMDSFVQAYNDPTVTPALNGVRQPVTPEIAQEVLPYLDLSEAVYEPSGAPEGWERLDTRAINGVPLHDANSGFNAELFKSTTSDEVVLAVRGTESPLPHYGDWVEDSRQAQGEVAPQMKHLLKVAEAASAEFGDQLTFTGHSLGGVLAQAAGLRTGHQTYAFDAPGLNAATQAFIGQDNLDKNEALITHIGFPGEFATDLDGHQDGDSAFVGGKLFGNVYYADDSGFNPFPLLDLPLTRHFITPMREALQETLGIPDRTDDSLDVVSWAGNYLFNSLTATR